MGKYRNEFKVANVRLGSQPNPEGIALLALLLDLVERMAAAGVGVGVREGYLRMQLILDHVKRGFPCDFTL